MGEACFEKCKTEFAVGTANKSILEKAFLLGDVHIPDFYVIDSEGRLHIRVDGKERVVSVNSIRNDYTLN